MDRNTIIGLTLLFILFLAWQQFTAPTQAEIAEQKRLQDSIEQANIQIAGNEKPAVDTAQVEKAAPVISDSARQLQLQEKFGAFATAASGANELGTIENDLMVLTYQTQGGRIKEVLLKEHFKLVENEQRKEEKMPLRLLEDDKNKFEFLIPVAGGQSINSADLFFAVAEKTESSVVLRADAGNGRYFEQRYSLEPGSYQVDYDLAFQGMNELIPAGSDAIQLNWVNYLDKLERNVNYEQRYSTVYFKESDDSYDYCSCTGDDTEDRPNQPIKWVSNVNQFFNSSLIADAAFSGANLQTRMLPKEADDLKLLVSEISIPFQHQSSESFGMTFYIGPNEFDRLYAINNQLQDIIPFGRSVFGSINRWIIRPIFNFLSLFIGSKGMVILMLTLIVKLLLFPLTYRMLYSQSKMAALKPQMEHVKEKHKDDPQQQQMETMKMYREFGVNPLGGCMPMLLQMPIWFALYRFFPASIEFRQASFLWATDLSSYDIIARLPFELPFNAGSHISLFTILWAITTLIYTYYNSRHMDMSANPAMKYMQYIMPIMFVGFFNSFASGLTCYLLFSNVLNIGQTLVTKNYIINHDKIRNELEANRKKPKKQGGFQQRLETALKEQQRIQAEKQSQASKPKKK
ncbi:MAG TPA: membrane protein insertase YidC [Saprospiraceae bacterium]|nr:membrane protein insertase YidC [Saprospiraceae bacterium]HMQ85452.1 membrane protein insertase YidC [Saprospiraceae bacterium]